MRPSSSRPAPRIPERIVAPWNWSAFLDEFTTEVAGSPVVVDVSAYGMRHAVVARGILEVMLFDERGDVVEIAVQIPAPGRPSLLRHHVSEPLSISTDAEGLRPTTLRVEGTDGRITQVQALPSAAFGG
jgi:hypothetical protein